jgi:hypothetical protein
VEPPQIKALTTDRMGDRYHSQIENPGLPALAPGLGLAPPPDTHRTAWSRRHHFQITVRSNRSCDQDVIWDILVVEHGELHQSFDRIF